MEKFKVNLEDFAAKHKEDIRKDPGFRVSFQEMCASIGVDPLACKSVYVSPSVCLFLSVHLSIHLSNFLIINVSVWLSSQTPCCTWWKRENSETKILILPLEYFQASLTVLKGWSQPRYFRQRLISITYSAADKKYIELSRSEILITQIKFNIQCSFRTSLLTYS